MFIHHMSSSFIYAFHSSVHPPDLTYWHVPSPSAYWVVSGHDATHNFWGGEACNFFVSDKEHLARQLAPSHNVSLRHEVHPLAPPVLQASHDESQRIHAFLAVPSSCPQYRPWEHTVTLIPSTVVGVGPGDDDNDFGDGDSGAGAGDGSGDGEWVVLAPPPFCLSFSAATNAPGSLVIAAITSVRFFPSLGSAPPVWFRLRSNVAKTSASLRSSIPPLPPPI